MRSTIIKAAVQAKPVGAEKERGRASASQATRLNSTSLLRPWPLQYFLYPGLVARTRMCGHCSVYWFRASLREPRRQTRPESSAALCEEAEVFLFGEAVGHAGQIVADGARQAMAVDAGAEVFGE
jgi:hypothetical protein